MNRPHPRYLAFDLETTGLDPNRDRILEIGYVVLDPALVELGRFSTVIRHDEKTLRSLCSDDVIDMHQTSGLWREVLTDENASMVAAEEGTLIKIAKVFPDPPVLLGSSIQFDRGFIRAQMRGLEPFLHYRMIDVRSVMLTLPDLGWPDPTKPEHRTLTDCDTAINRVRYARRVLQALDARLDETKGWTDDLWALRYGPDVE